MSYLFKSALAGSIDKFLRHKRDLGFKYNSGEYTLLSVLSRGVVQFSKLWWAVKLNATFE